MVRRSNGGRNSQSSRLYDEFTSDENGENPLSPEEGEKKIKKLGGYDKIYRIKFEADYLAELAYKGAKKRYGDPLSKEVDDRIRFELHIMKTMGFPGYFLIVQDFINSARDELGVMVGPDVAPRQALWSPIVWVSPRLTR